VTEKIGIGERTYHNIESNLRKPKEEELEKIATLFEVALDDLKNNEPIIVFEKIENYQGNINGHIRNNTVNMTDIELKYNLLKDIIASKDEIINSKDEIINQLKLRIEILEK